MLLVLRAVEDIPEAEGLITSASEDGLTSGTHGQVQHAVGMSRQRSHLAYGLLFPVTTGIPKVDLVETIAVGRDHLVGDFGKD